jgi:HAD superfamily hydrolase (TIGR01484 family)
MTGSAVTEAANRGLLRAVVSDVDGTLLDTRGELPDLNVAAMQAACAAGIRIALATVRKRDTAERIVDLLGVPCGLVCEAGATIFDADGTLLRSVTLPLEIALAIADLADELSFPMATTIDGVNYQGPGYTPPLLVGGPVHAVPSNRVALKQAPTRLIIQDLRAAALVVDTFADAPLHVVRHYRSDGSFIDAVITHRDATKVTGIGILLDHWGIGWDEVMALGDAEADVPMLQRARIGVAVGNATRDAKEAADFVSVPAEEGGVALAIERFI